MDWIKTSMGFKTDLPKHRDYIKPCHSPCTDQIYYSITLLYTGDRKYLSDEIESFFDLTSLKGFSVLKISGQREHQWLASNQQEIVVKEFPTFLIAREGYPTIVVPENKASQMKELILKLSQEE
uniref:Uncharacterized protein n=1 Tax=Pithovirus LCPAC202 TaxID=2506592 RepID=A0A481Z5M7_9VIRU|nr:MAG: hypothetical protein LCPAC202_00410 [Pithovirus LCPAC202]